MDVLEKIILVGGIVIIIIIIVGCSLQIVNDNICHSKGYTTSDGWNSCICKKYEMGGTLKIEEVPMELITSGYVSPLGCGQ